MDDGVLNDRGIIKRHLESEEMVGSRFKFFDTNLLSVQSKSVYVWTDRSLILSIIPLLSEVLLSTSFIVLDTSSHVLSEIEDFLPQGTLSRDNGRKTRHKTQRKT
jgi:hypothetical protein